ncbi:hypothetical protein Shyhy01_27280 [Streptomyces hygroscopicus subsp. hygroscopicus]|nr:hypothetical protein Shyhy01_27280 [Streptomyces hygroscopicus subsp. hygroscopicus]
MLMLQPPGRGSTYRYLLPPIVGRKHTVDVTAPIQPMHSGRNRCMRDVPLGGAEGRMAWT